MKSYPKHLKEVEEKLREAKSSDKVIKFKDLQKYIGTNYDMVGLSVPKSREVFKTGFSFSHLPTNEQFPIWDYIWKTSQLFEAMSLAILYIEKHLKKSDPAEIWNYIRVWVTKIDNWAHSDGLSGFYSYLLEQNPKLIFPQLRTWNKSANPWERRQSLVSLVEYHKKRELVLPAAQMFPLVKNLLQDEEYYVQKGLGWALREIGNAYPNETWEFLKAYCGEIAPAAFTAAIEKLSPNNKEKLKLLRKECRKKK